MIRVHQVRHPHFGIVGWRELLKLLKQRKGRTGIRECSWCLGPVPAGSRTKCGSEACESEIGGLFRWEIRVRQAYRKYGRKCLLCGAGALEIDHIIPVSLGGTGDLDNLRPLCTCCHRAETKRLQTDGADFRARVAN
jgi:5-methylcytosine-specific restriction endonuclease McrA